MYKYFQQTSFVKNIIIYVNCLKIGRYTVFTCMFVVLLRFLMTFASFLDCVYIYIPLSPPSYIPNYTNCSHISLFVVNGQCMKKLNMRIRIVKWQTTKIPKTQTN